MLHLHRLRAPGATGRASPWRRARPGLQNLARHRRGEPPGRVAAPPRGASGSRIDEAAGLVGEQTVSRRPGASTVAAMRAPSSSNARSAPALAVRRARDARVRRARGDECRHRRMHAHHRSASPSSEIAASARAAPSRRQPSRRAQGECGSRRAAARAASRRVISNAQARRGERGRRARRRRQQRVAMARDEAGIDRARGEIGLAREAAAGNRDWWRRRRCA